MANALDNGYEEVKMVDAEAEDTSTEIWLLLNNYVLPKQVPDESLLLENIVDYSAAKQLSKLVRTVAEDAKIDQITTTGGRTIYVLNLPLENKQTLDNICKYINMNAKNIPKDDDVPDKPLESPDFAKCKKVRKVDCDFIFPLNKHNGLYEVILAANQLDMHHLLHMAGAYVASGMKGKSLEEICEYLSLDKKQVEEVKEDA
jgi:hypothetical protein